MSSPVLISSCFSSDGKSLSPPLPSLPMAWRMPATPATIGAAIRRAPTHHRTPQSVHNSFPMDINVFARSYHRDAIAAVRGPFTGKADLIAQPRRSRPFIPKRVHIWELCRKTARLSGPSPDQSRSATANSADTHNMVELVSERRIGRRTSRHNFRCLLLRQSAYYRPAQRNKDDTSPIGLDIAYYPPRIALDPRLNSQYQPFDPLPFRLLISSSAFRIALSGPKPKRLPRRSRMGTFDPICQRPGVRLLFASGRGCSKCRSCHCSR